MANQLNPTIRSYIHENTARRYVRLEEVCKEFEMDKEIVKVLACSAGALYPLPRIKLIHNKNLETYMKH